MGYLLRVFPKTTSRGDGIERSPCHTKNTTIETSLLVKAGRSEFIKQGVSERRGVSVIVKRIVEAEAKRGIVRIGPLAERLYLKVAFLYLKEERFNATLKTLVQYMEDRGRRIIKT
jgi:hypothetical protein